jgi:hypothetical protein
MRLYSLIEGTADVRHKGVRYAAGPDGGFDFPNEVSGELHSFHIGGRPMWEDQIERQRRLIQEEAARRADPATLLDAVEKLVRAAGATAEPAEARADPKPAARKTAAAKAAA